MKNKIKKLFLKINNKYISFKIKNKEYLVIRRKNGNIGLGSYIITTLGAINYAIKNNLKPIIDLRLNGKSEENLWNAFFIPTVTPQNKSINSKKILITQKIYDLRPNDSMDFLTNPKLINYWHKLFVEYVQFNEETKKYVESNYKSIIGAKQNVLGVLCRGTDYVSLRPYNHPVQPTTDEIIKKINDISFKIKIDYIYLATEDQKILNEFIKKFKDKLLYDGSKRYNYSEKKYLNEIDKEDNTDIHSKNLDYLSNLYILSKCDYFIGGRTSGTVTALLMSENWKYTYFWNKGRYGIDDNLK